jgi:hypothetical protein
MQVAGDDAVIDYVGIEVREVEIPDGLSNQKDDQYCDWSSVGSQVGAK